MTEIREKLGEITSVNDRDNSIEKIIMEWKRPYLVQILNQPYPVDNSKLERLANVFSFGCCGPESFGKEAMEMIRQLWTWEYMGAAEYEFGEAPKAMKSVCDYVIKNEYFAGYIEVENDEMILNKEGYKDYWTKKKPKKVTSKVFILCHKDHVNKVKEFIKTIASTSIEHKNYEVTRDRTDIEIALYNGKQKLGYPFPAIGGLNLDNDFIYMTYEPSIQKMIEMFGLKL